MFDKVIEQMQRLIDDLAADDWQERILSRAPRDWQI